MISAALKKTDGRPQIIVGVWNRAGKQRKHQGQARNAPLRSTWTRDTPGKIPISNQNCRPIQRQAISGG